MMQVVKDPSLLDAGDEVLIILRASNLVNVKLLRKPVPDGTNWCGIPRYKRVKVTLKKESKTYTFNRASGGTHSWTKRTSEFAPIEEHNTTKYVDFTDREFVILKKANHEN